jgi:hypothetical protein
MIFSLRQAGKLTKSEQLKKNQDALKALSDKAFALFQTLKAESDKNQQEAERFKFKQDQESFSYKQKFDSILSKAALNTAEKETLALNQARLRANNNLPPAGDSTLNSILNDCKAVQQLPGAVKYTPA